MLVYGVKEILEEYTTNNQIQSCQIVEKLKNLDLRRRILCHLT